MKKFINNPNTFVEDSLRGILTAYSDSLRPHPKDLKAIFRVGFEDRNKVSIITGGGYGHLPAFLGYVGKGLCDGAAVGNVFSSPSANTIYNVTTSVPSKNGVLYVIGNYMGDLMNFEMAAEKSLVDNIQTAIVSVSDDVASAPRDEWKNRRGISGIVFIYKVVGAAAVSGRSLEELIRIAEKANENLASYGVAFTPCQLPGTNSPVFEISGDEMELGIGIHGEPGVRRTRIMSSRDIAALTADTLINDLSLQKGDRIAVLVNGLGATSKEEQFLLYQDVYTLFSSYGIQPVRSFVGEYATSLEMSGASVSVLRLDDELLRLIDEPAASPFVCFQGANKDFEKDRSV